MRIRRTPEAADNPEEIHQYLYLHRLGLAHPTVQRIYDGIYSLRQMAHRGRPGRAGKSEQFLIPDLPFQVAYMLKDDTVEIASIRHTSREPLNL
jgi:plasmid stabilization system protein ParE